MNDNFLSRGKLKHDNLPYKKGDWVYGNYVELKDGDRTIHCIYGYGEIIPETAGRYTCLTDKNSKQIFEGDFIQAGNYIFAVKFGKCGGVQNVEHEVGYVGFYVEPIGENAKLFSDSGLRTDILYWINAVGIEVIGNFHDNPELSGGETIET